MAIAVARLAGAQRVAAASHAITLPATANVGDLIVLAIALKTGTSQSISSISGLGATWNLITIGTATGQNSRATMWYGIVGTAGTAITITPTASLALTWDAFQITGHDPATPIQANSVNGTASADTVSDTTYNMGSPNPTNAANVAIAMLSATATSARTYSGLTSGWTEGMAFGATSTLHAAYSAYRTNMPTGAAALAVTATVAAQNGYAWVVINEAAATGDPISAPDTSAVASSDAVSSAVAASAADADAVASTDAASTAVAASVADTDAVAGTDAVAITVSDSFPDTSAVGSTDAATSAITATLSDESAVSGLESLSVAIAGSVDDSAAVDSSDAVSVQSATPVADVGAVLSVDGVSIAVTMSVADSGAVASADMVSGPEPEGDIPKTFNDAGHVTSIDAVAVAVTLAIIDVSAIGSEDLTGALVQQAVIDAASVISTGELSTMLTMLVADNSAVLSADFASMVEPVALGLTPLTPVGVARHYATRARGSLPAAGGGAKKWQDTGANSGPVDTQGEGRKF